MVILSSVTDLNSIFPAGEPGTSDKKIKRNIVQIKTMFLYF